MESRVLSRMRNAIGVVSVGAEADEGEKPPRVAMVVDVADANFLGGFIPALVEKQRYPYCRPEFVYFSEEEIALSSDHSIRPVICPKFVDRMPLFAGYAEVINAGKTNENEDQASAKVLNLTQLGNDAEEAKVLDGRFTENGDYTKSVDDAPLIGSELDSPTESGSSGPRAEAVLFSIFDGHAGTGAAIIASKCLHEHVKSRLSDVLESILHLDRQESYCLSRKRSESAYSISKSDYGGSSEASTRITSRDLITGALEAAFVDMDEQIAQEKHVFKISGGCAVISALLFQGTVYVANAGDCRAVLVTSEGVRQMSQDFTPATERKRLQTLAFRQPELIGSCFSRLEYSRFLSKKDLKKKVLYRDWYMDGWAAKTVRDSDLRPPLISDRLKKKRLLNTIGVSRGFGDHHLLTADDKLPIKPFLSPVPEVRVFDIRSLNILTDKDLLILASDGLWDVLSNEDAARIVQSALSAYDEKDMSRYTMAAQELVVAARGNPTQNHRWTMNVGGPASADDITVIVIPLKYALVPPKSQDEEEDDDMLSLDS